MRRHVRRAVFALLVLSLPFALGTAIGCQILSGVSGLVVDLEEPGPAPNEGGFIDPGDGAPVGDGGTDADGNLEGGAEQVLVRIEIRKVGGGDVAAVRVNGVNICAGAACTGTVIAMVPRAGDGPAGFATVAADAVAGSNAHFVEPATCRAMANGCEVGLTAAFVRVTLQVVAANYVFATSTKYTGGLGGLAGADAKCTAAATAAGLPGTYAAWLSDSTTNAPARLGTARGFVRVDGLPFSDTVEATAGHDLVEGRIFYPPALDQLGVAVPKNDFVWTGTSAAGVFSGASCIDWTSALATESGGTGLPQTGSVTWTNRGTGDTCEKQGRLLCFRKDRTTPVAPVARPMPSRLAFVTAAPLTMGALGITDADTLCSVEATTAGLTGSFKAYLATTAAAAQTRFALTAAKGGWYRVDGTPFVADPALLMNVSGRPVAPLTQRADGSYMDDNPTSHVDVWTGMNGAPNAKSTDATFSCADWTDATAAGTGRFGQASFIDERFSSSGTDACSTPRPIYCLQE